MKLDTEDLISIVVIFVIALYCILFIGAPDLHDAILYRLSDGKIPIPVEAPPKLEVK